MLETMFNSKAQESIVSLTKAVVSSVHLRRTQSNRSLHFLASKLLKNSGEEMLRTKWDERFRYLNYVLTAR